MINVLWEGSSVGNAVNEQSFDRESIASQCMDIHKNPRRSKLISLKAWIIED